MGRKKHRKKSPTTDTGKSALLADEHFRQGRYREALKGYKSLLQAEPQNDEWLQRLFACYRIRATELMGKQLYKEALVLWENYYNLDRTQFLQETSVIEDYVACLLVTKAFDKAITLYIRHETVIAELPCAKNLLSHLAMQLLIGNNTCKKRLQAAVENNPENTASAISVLLQHSQTASEAIQAYCSGDDERLPSLLKQIPHRSSYRDLGRVLKALLANEQTAAPDSSKMNALLSSIDPQSAFYPFADTLVSFCSSPQHAVETLLDAPASVQLVLGEISGWTKDTQKVLRQTPVGASRHHPGKQLQFLLLHKDLLPETVLRQACQTLLKRYPQGLKLYERRFGKLSPFQHALFAAHAAKTNDYADDEYDSWQRILEMDDAALTPVIKATILRYLSELAYKLDHRFCPHCDAIVSLEKSLRHDPAYKPAYLRLLELASGDEDEKLRQQWIATAVKRFPEDRDILKLAIQTAQKKGTHKKAATLTKKLLKIDPLSREARELLLDTHLGQARKHLQKKKYSAAKKELNTALSFDNPDSGQAALIALQALLAHEEGHTEQARQLFRAATGNAIAPLQALLILHLESSALYGRHPDAISTVTAIAGPKLLSALPSAVELIACFKYVRQLFARGDTAFLKDAVENLAGDLETAGERLAQHADHLLCCTCLYEIQACGLLQYFSRSALSAFGDDLLFRFYEIWANAEGQALDPDGDEFNELEDLLDRATSQGDKRAEHLIIRFIDRSDSVFAFPDLPPLPPGPGQVDPSLIQIFDIIQKLSNMSQDEALRTIDSLNPMQRGLLEEFMQNIPDVDGGMDDDFFPMPRRHGGKKKKPGRKKDHNAAQRLLDF